MSHPVGQDTWRNCLDFGGTATSTFLVPIVGETPAISGSHILSRPRVSILNHKKTEQKMQVFSKEVIEVMLASRGTPAD